jgi:hypothetical protein
VELVEGHPAGDVGVHDLQQLLLKGKEETVSVRVECTRGRDEAARCAPQYSKVTKIYPDLAR